MTGDPSINDDVILEDADNSDAVRKALQRERQAAKDAQKRLRELIEEIQEVLDDFL